ncbi:MAG: hypothetical protein Ct9H300mP28_33750 [Pseudomonadota bacterium]|nr:MAG: hypothetical protein Ct9H300mP28_33750 [Pseudomonadota bacterium]
MQLLTGHGGIDKLVYKTDVEVPVPKTWRSFISVKGLESTTQN